MIQWLGIVAGTVAMCATAFLFGERVPQGGSTVGISGNPPYSIPTGVSVPLDAAAVEILRAVLLPPTTTPPTTTRAGTVGFDQSGTAPAKAVADGTGVRIPAGPHLDMWGDSGPPVSGVGAGVPVADTLEDIVARFFPGDEYAVAAAVVACESNWNPDAIWSGAKNKTPQTKSAAGLFQFIQRTWVWVAEDAGVDPDPAARLDPVQATQAARHLVDRAGGGWSHWECDPR